MQEDNFILMKTDSFINLTLTKPENTLMDQTQDKSLLLTLMVIFTHSILMELQPIQLDHLKELLFTRIKKVTSTKPTLMVPKLMLLDPMLVKLPVLTIMDILIHLILMAQEPILLDHMQVKPTLLILMEVSTHWLKMVNVLMLQVKILATLFMLIYKELHTFKMPMEQEPTLQDH